MKVLSIPELTKKYSKLSYHERIIISEIIKSYIGETNSKIIRFPGKHKIGGC